MSNYGTNIGNDNTFEGPTSIKNRTTIKKKSNIAISVAIGTIVVIVIIFIFLHSPKKYNITGVWTTTDGEQIEFMSDGTLQEGDYYTSLYADTYEIMDEGYLKWGKYDTSWIEYKYTYWNISLKGDKLTLTRRDDPEEIIELTKK